MGAELCSGCGSFLSERGLCLVCVGTDERPPAASQQLHEASRELRTYQPAVLADEAGGAAPAPRGALPGSGTAPWTGRAPAAASPSSATPKRTGSAASVSTT